MALTELELLESVIPEVTIRNVLLENYNDAGMLATVEYAAYDVVDDSAISKFFADPSFDKYLRIKTQYNTNPSRTNPSTWSTDSNQPQKLSDFFTDSNYFKSKTLSDGSIRKEFRWTKQYKFVDLRPTHLEFYIKSFIDTSAIEEDMMLDPDTFVLDTQSSSSVNTDWLVVLKWSLGSASSTGSVLGTRRTQRPDSKLVPTTKVYGKKVMYIYNEDIEGGQQNLRKEWHGPVHSMNNRYENWMTGKIHTEDSFEVRRVEERFRDIQDFRDLDNTNSHANDGEYLDVNGTIQYGPQGFDSHQDLLFKVSRYERESILELENAARETDAFISDIWVSRSISGNARFITALDLKRLLYYNSRFAKYLDNMSDETISELCSSMSIISLRIKRKRIQKIKIAKEGHEYIDFKDDNYQDEVVVETVRPPNSNQVTQVRTRTGSIRQISLPQETDLVFLTGTDYTMSEITDGIYTYGLDIKVLDPTRDYLRDKVEQLYPYIIALNTIRTQVENSQNFYDRTAQAYNRGFVEDFEIDFRDVKYGRLEFYDSFVSDRQVLYVDFMQEVLEKYFDTLRVFKRTDYGEAANFITGLKTAAKTSPKGLGLLTSILQTLCNRLSSIVGLKDIGFDDLGNTTINKNSLHEIYKSKYCMSENSIWDSNVPHGSGIDYLTDPLVEVSELQRLQEDDQSIGLRVIKPGQFVVRQMNEVSRFFNDQEMVINLPVTGIPTSDNVSLTGAGSSFFTPSAFINNNAIYQHDTDNNNSSETIVNNFLPLVNNYSPNSNYGQPAPPSNQPISGGGDGVNMSQNPISSARRASMARNIFSDFNVTFENYGSISNIVDRNTISSQLEDILNTCIAVNVPGRPIDPHVDLSPSPETSESLNLPSSRAFDLGSYALRRMRRVFMSSANMITDGLAPPTPPRPNSSYDSELAPNVPISANYDVSSSSAISNSILPTANIENFIDQLPNQIKSLMLSSIPQNEARTGNDYSIQSGLDLRLSGVYQINTGFLATIECFRRFGRSRGRRGNRPVGAISRRINFSKAKWEELTIDKYREYAGERLLCRIRKADLADLGIQQNDFGIPIYDSYFFIEPTVDTVVASSTDIIQDARDQREANAAIAQRRAEARLAVEDAQLEKARLIRRNEDMRTENERMERDSGRLQDLIDRTDDSIEEMVRRPESYHADYNMLLEAGEIVEIGNTGRRDTRYGSQQERIENLTEITEQQYNEWLNGDGRGNYVKRVMQMSNTPLRHLDGTPIMSNGEVVYEPVYEYDETRQLQDGSYSRSPVYKYYLVEVSFRNTEELLTPEQWQRRFSMLGGDIYEYRETFVGASEHHLWFSHRLRPGLYAWYSSRLQAMETYKNMIEANSVAIDQNEDMIAGHQAAIVGASDDEIVNHAQVGNLEFENERKIEDLRRRLAALGQRAFQLREQQEALLTQEEYCEGHFHAPPRHRSNDLNGDGQWIFDRLQEEFDSLQASMDELEDQLQRAIQDHYDGGYIEPFAQD